MSNGLRRCIQMYLWKEALAVLYLHPADFCPLATRKSYICTRLVSLLVALECNGHFEAVLESEGVMC